MKLTALFSAPLIVQLHASCAIAALALGGVQLIRRKGGGTHRIMGYIWVVLMLTIAMSSFWIHDINQWYGFSLIHLLSILTLISVPLAVHTVRQGNVAGHRRAMISIFCGALVVAGLFTLLPGRLMYQVFFG